MATLTNSSTFTINSVQGAEAQATITLEEYLENGSTYVLVKVDVNSSVATGDIDGVYFNVLNNKTGFNIVEDGTVVTDSSINYDSLNIGGNSKFDAFAQIGFPGNGDVFINDLVTVRVNGIKLSDLAGQNFGVRLKSVDGVGSNQTSVLVGSTFGSGGGSGGGGSAPVLEVIKRFVVNGGNSDLEKLVAGESGSFVIKITNKGSSAASFSIKDVVDSALDVTRLTFLNGGNLVTTNDTGTSSNLINLNIANLGANGVVEFRVDFSASPSNPNNFLKLDLKAITGDVANVNAYDRVFLDGSINLYSDIVTKISDTKWTFGKTITNTVQATYGSNRAVTLAGASDLSDDLAISVGGAQASLNNTATARYAFDTVDVESGSTKWTIKGTGTNTSELGEYFSFDDFNLRYITEFAAQSSPTDLINYLKTTANAGGYGSNKFLGGGYTIDNASKFTGDYVPFNFAEIKTIDGNNSGSIYPIFVDNNNFNLDAALATAATNADVIAGRKSIVVYVNADAVNTINLQTWNPSTFPYNQVSSIQVYNAEPNYQLTFFAGNGVAKLASLAPIFYFSDSLNRTTLSPLQNAVGGTTTVFSGYNSGLGETYDFRNAPIGSWTNLVINGNNGVDILYGRAFNDRINGGGGGDTIDGFKSINYTGTITPDKLTSATIAQIGDIYTGGAGKDKFVLGPDLFATIADYDGDEIAIRGLSPSQVKAVSNTSNGSTRVLIIQDLNGSNSWQSGERILGWLQGYTGSLSTVNRNITLA